MDLHVYRNSQDRWHDLKKAARGRGVLAVNAVTLQELIERLTPDVQDATAAQKLILVDRALNEAGSLRHACDAISDLRAAGHTGENSGSDVQRLTPNFPEVLRQYEAGLRDAGLVDTEGRCWMAAKRVKEGRHDWLSRFQSVTLHAIYDLNEAEFALIHNVIDVMPDGGTVILFNNTANVKPTQFAEWTWRRFVNDETVSDKTFPEFCRPSSPNSALLERLFVFDAPAGVHSGNLLEPSGTLRVIQARGRYREIEFIGSEIAGLLERKHDANEIAVVVRNIETYGEMIEDVFSRYRIPHSFDTGVPLLRMPFIKYWFAQLDLAFGDRTRNAMSRVLSSAYFQPRLSPATDVEKELAAFGYIDRHHLSASSLAARKHSPLATELLRFEEWLDSLENSTDSISGFLRRLSPPRTLPARDAQAWSVLAEELRSVDVMAGEIHFRDFGRLSLDIAARRTVDRLPEQAAAPGFPRVPVIGPRSLGYRDYRWIFAPGFADGEVPARSPANPLLPDDLIEAINKQSSRRSLLTSRDRSRRDPLYLFMTLDSARDQVTITFPGSTLEGEPIYPSIYVGEIDRHFATSIIARMPHELTALEPGENLRRIADAWRRGSIEKPAAARLLGEDLMHRAHIESRGAERSDIGPGAIPVNVAWHPSDLNALESCPFVFLARSRLRLRVTEIPDFEIPVTEIGKLAHDVLREFYLQPVPVFETEAMVRMEQIIARRLANSDVSGQGSFSVFDPALWKIRRAQLVAALQQYVRFAVNDALDEYVTVPEYLDSPLPRAALGSLLLGGRPDHIAVHRTAGRIDGIRIDDFKYSAASSATNKLLKDSFQIPVYAYLAVRALGADPMARIEGRYLLLRSPSTPVVSHSLDQGAFDEVGARIEALLEKVRAGMLHPEPLDKQDCASCDYRRLCRLYGGLA